jgi:hypothetical protein
MIGSYLMDSEMKFREFSEFRGTFSIQSWQK